MSEKRLTDMAILSIENDLSEAVNLEEVVTVFGGRDQNRTIVLLFE